MITAIVNPTERTATITYPAFAKMKPVVIKVRSYQDAVSILHIRQLKFVSNEIRAYINSRNYAYSVTNTLTPERQRALNHLRFVVDSYSEGSFVRLAKHIANSRTSFATIMPTKDSPAKTYFNNHIIPIIAYCTAVYQESLTNTN